MERPCKQHDLKILPAYFEEVNAGIKNFEVRKNDRNFRAGDWLLLQEYDGKQYTGRTIRKRVQYVYAGTGEYGLAEGYCILGLQGPCVTINMNGNNNTQIGYVGKLTL